MGGALFPPCCLSWGQTMVRVMKIEWFYEDLQHLLVLKMERKKKMPFHYRGLECQSIKSRNTWSNSQIWPWSTEGNSEKTNRVLQREYTSHSKHPLPTTQEKTLHMDITRWSIWKSDWLYSLQSKMEKQQSTKTRLRADCGSEHELIDKVRLKLKKVGKNH